MKLIIDTLDEINNIITQIDLFCNFPREEIAETYSKPIVLKNNKYGLIIDNLKVKDCISEYNIVGFVESLNKLCIELTENELKDLVFKRNLIN